MSRLRIVRGGRSAEADAPAAGKRSGGDTDRTLLARVVSGDLGAHRTLYDRYRARIFSFVRRRVADEGLAEEVTADVFVEIWRHAAAYRGESQVSTWIFGIANLKALAARRHQAQPRRASVRVTPDEALHRFADPNDPRHSIEMRDELARLLRAIDRLPKGHRDVLRLAFLEGRSYQEIAEELGISEGNVKTRVNRARTRLRGLAQTNMGRGTQ